MGQRKEVVLEILELHKEFYLSKVCKSAGISRPCIYYKQKIQAVNPPGRKPPGYTINRDGILISDQTIISILKGYRQEVVFLNAGGVKKLSKYMAVEKRIYVNHKKVYRLCDENKLLLFKQDFLKKRKFKKNRCEYFEVSKPNELWQFDLKYIWIHGEQRWCFLLAFIDVVSKKVTGYYLGKTCKAGDLVFTLNEAIKAEGITDGQSLIIRSYNGPQMSSNRFYFYLKTLENKLTHEFIPPRSPNRNAFIKAFNSIIELEILQVRYFKTFETVYEAVMKFIEFYNVRRLHGSLGFLSPKMFIEGVNNGSIAPRVVAV